MYKFGVTVDEFLIGSDVLGSEAPGSVPERSDLRSRNPEPSGGTRHKICCHCVIVQQLSGRVASVYIPSKSTDFVGYTNHMINEHIRYGIIGTGMMGIEPLTQYETEVREGVVHLKVPKNERW